MTEIQVLRRSLSSFAKNMMSVLFYDRDTGIETFEHDTIRAIFIKRFIL